MTYTLELIKICLYPKANMTLKPNLPPNHRWVETSDGSLTLFSEVFQETCHSPTGAREETLLHYVNGCHIEEKINSAEPLSILEVGFGLGVGFITTYDVLLETKKKWSFLSLELDEHLLEWFRQESHAHPFLSKLQWKTENEIKMLCAQDEYIDLTILCGDARLNLPKYCELHHPSWNAIYQDAFSPKKNPTLWSVEWFDLLKSYSNHDVLLSTYSASDSIRKSLTEAGWKLHKGEKFGKKRTSTRATLEGTTDPDILLILDRSPVKAFRDATIGLL